MQSRKYYFAGHQLLTQSYSGFIQSADIALYDHYPVTPSRVVASIGDHLTVYDDVKMLAKYQLPVYGDGWELYERSEYRVPIITVYIPDVSKMQPQNNNAYRISRKHVIIESVTVCGESYTSAFYSSAYHSMVKGGRPDKLVTEIKALFRDYAHPRFGLFLTLHWNRHYTHMADEIVRDMPTTIGEAYHYLLIQRRKIEDKNQTNLNGSFMRRMDFVIGKLLVAIDNVNENSVKLAQ